MLYGNKRIIKHKIRLLNFAEELIDVTRSCKIKGPFPFIDLHCRQYCIFC